MKDSFILYTEQKAVIDKLTDEQAGKLIKAIYEYVATDKTPQLDMTMDLVITPFITALDRNKEKYEETCKKRALAGSKGGKQKVANASKCKQNIANVADNDSDSENDNEYDNDSDTATAVIGGDSCDDGFPQSDSRVDEVVKFYEENYGTMSPFIYETLNDYRNDFTDDIIVYALKLGVEANAKNIKYVKAILSNWEKADVKTLLDAKNENKKKVKEDIKPKNTIKQDTQFGDLNKFYAN